LAARSSQQARTLLATRNLSTGNISLGDKKALGAKKALGDKKPLDRQHTSWQTTHLSTNDIPLGGNKPLMFIQAVPGTQLENC
jgi:hypothetical protein